MTFKDFLNEGPSSYKKISKQMGLGMLPITDKIIQSLGFGERKIVFHATNLKHLKDLKKTGRTKKPISTFTRGLETLLYGGMAVNPDVIARLEGTAVMEYEGDAYSQPDHQGRRWVPTHGAQKSKFLQDALMTKPIELMWKFLDDDIVRTDTNKIVNTFDEFYNLVRYDDFYFERVFNGYLTGKEKQKVIALYIANAENLMSNTMYSKIVNQLLTRDDSGFDEVIMNKFKVLGVYSISHGKFNFKHNDAKEVIEGLGYKYLGHIPEDEFKKVTPETY
jgi:hypothetical protein